MKVYNGKTANQDNSFMNKVIDLRDSFNPTNSWLFIKKRPTFWYAENKNGDIYSNDGKKFYVTKKSLISAMSHTLDTSFKHQSHWKFIDARDEWAKDGAWFGKGWDAIKRAREYFEQNYTVNVLSDDGEEAVNKLINSGDIILKEISL